jgi:hypothetical protein
MVSRKPSDAEKREYIWDLSLTNVSSGKDTRIDASVPGQSFVVLQPKQFYETETEVPVFVRRNAVGPPADGVLPGDYLLQLTVSTWPESSNLANLLRSRWQGIGTLWSSSITSTPMSFKVARNQRLAECPP